MIAERNCEYFIIKYVPNVASGNDMNIGVLLREASVQSDQTTGVSPPFVGVRFLEDWAVLNCFGSVVDLEVVLAIVADIASKVDTATAGRSRLSNLLRELGSASNGVVLGPPRGLVTTDPAETLRELAARYLPERSGRIRL